MPILLVVLFSGATGPVEAPEASTVEQAVIDGRRGLESGAVRLLMISVDPETGEPRSKFWYDITFEGGNLRFIRNRGPQDDISGPDEKMVLTDENYLRHSDEISDSGKPQAAVIRAASAGEDAPLFDPRLLGVIPQSLGILHSSHLEEYLGRFADENSTVERVQLGGVEVYQVEHRIDLGEQTDVLRTWIDPRRGHSVLRMEFEWTDGGTVLLDRIDSTVAQYPEGEVWYPKEVRYRRFRNGEPIMDETTTIEQARFNDDIDDPVFRLGGLNLPKGTHVHDYSGPVRVPVRKWDGEKLVPVPAAELAGPLPVGVAPERRNGIWILVAVNLAVLAILFLAKFLHENWRTKTR